MSTAGVLADPARLKELRATRLLDSPPELSFDRLTRLAARILNTPVSLVSLVDDHRQFFKSALGLPEPWSTLRETPLSHSICQDVVKSGQPLVVSDAREHPTLSNNLAIRDLNVIGYLGAPIATTSGQTIGAYCVIDDRPRSWTDYDIEIMTDLADSVATEIQLRLELQENRSKTQQILDHKARLKSVLEGSIDGMLLLDETGSVLECNRAAESMLGRNRSQIQGQRFARIALHPRDHRRFQAQMENASRSSRDHLHEFQGSCPHDLEPAWEMAINPVNHTGSPQWTITLRDMRLRKHAEDELRRAAEAAQVANQAKSQLFYHVSHEFRTPMSAILGYVELLAERSEALPQECRHYLDIIYQNSNHLIHLVNDVLDLAKLESGQLDVNLTSVDLRQLIDEVVSLLQVRAQEQQLELSQHVDPVVPDRILTDGLRLRQILLNLVGNAIKFTDQGFVKILTRTVRESSDSYQLQLEVIDTGIGMTEEQSARVLSAYQQADVSPSRQTTGTGLGLTISLRLAELLGGSLSLQSQFGIGTTCRVLLPLKEDVNPQKSQPQDLIETPLDSSLLQGLRVLLAEDSSSIQMLVDLLLSRHGMILDLASDGLEAWELFERSARDQQPYDLILLDMQMPKLDGYELASKIRSQDVRSPVIALTAYAIEGERQRCLEYGCSDYLRKPFQPRELLEMVSRWSRSDHSSK